tara:strand:- start:216 stop:419 length:204 start_codon:yes stop_codon:yes gene_type:complete
MITTALGIEKKSSKCEQQTNLEDDEEEEEEEQRERLEKLARILSSLSSLSVWCLFKSSSQNGRKSRG